MHGCTLQDHPCGNITVQVLYCNMEDEDIRYFHEKYTRAELEQWFGQLLESIIRGQNFM